MDSMRHLSTSLPFGRAAQTQDLLVDFKAAALSVTNLYKTAAAAQGKARHAGYQDALDDLLSFLDRENIGLMDGEGWSIRQWATKRLDDAIPRPTGSDDEEEDIVENASETRSSSPEIQRKPAPVLSGSEMSEEVTTSRRGVSEPLPPQADTPIHPPLAPQTTYDIPTSDFTFRSSTTYPSQQDRETNMEVDPSAETPKAFTRTKSRHNTHHRARNDGRSSSLQLGGIAGSKRKMTFPDFFDLSGFNFDIPEKKDAAPRGTKKGRFA